MDFKQVVGNRRTIRYFKSWQPVEAAKIQTILEAGRLQSQHGNAKLIRKAVVIERGKSADDVRDGLIDAMYSQPHVQQAPVFIVWAIDMSGWDSLRDALTELIEVRALNSTHGWSKEFIETAVIPNADFNVMAGDHVFAEWLSAFECGLAVGSALLAAVNEGLGTALVTGRRAQIREILDMPKFVTPTQVQLVGYPAESPNAGGQRPSPDFENLYFTGKWGVPLKSDPTVTAQLKAAGMLQEQAPVRWRADEIRALAHLFGLPE
ncbi:MAG TPA: nitroreductase family protein [Candidatus Binataceae bacterium]|jgi:nitroreductase|nr:nitroreductase family protein [Candidatus Binataceae bacterium]